MEKTKRQHYVPRMYMKRFGYGSPEEPLVSVLIIKRSEILNDQNIENFAVSKFFYDMKKSELEKVLSETFKLYPQLREYQNLNDEQFVEHACSREESAISQLLNELEVDLNLIYKDTNRTKMIEFLHSMAYRTKYFRDKMDKINKQTMEVLSEICDNVGLSEEEKQKELERHCYTGKEIQIYQMLDISSTLQTLDKLLGNYEWYMAYNDTELDFVISDNPFQTVWNGLNDICVPISKSRAYILRVKDKRAPLFSKDMPNRNNIINLSLNSVIAYNSLQLGMAQFYLFGTKRAINFMKNINDLKIALYNQNKRN